MSEIFFRPSLIEQGIVEGFDVKIDYNNLKHLRESIQREIDTVIQNVRDAILAQSDPIIAMFWAGLFKFTTGVKLEGLENIPSCGKIVVVCNHPFPFVDDFALMFNVVNLNIARPWAFIGNTSSISRYFPDWSKNPSFSHRIIPVRRAYDDSFSAATNGTEVVNAAIQFLRMHQDPLLFIAADGSNSIFQNRIAQPYAGFAKIAKLSGAKIIPVLFTGKADIQNLAFEVCGKIFKGYETQGDLPEIIDVWCKVVQKELDKRKRK